MRWWLILLAALFLRSGVWAQQPPLTVVAHDSFAYTEEVMEAFEEETGIPVEVVRVGDAGTLVNQSILTRENPLGDVLFGVDNTFLSRALEADLFEPYESPLLEHVPDEFELDDEYRVTPIDYGDVCLNYDAAFFAAEDAPPLPESLRDLTLPAYEGLLVVENPTTSSPGLAFLLATVAVFGEEGDYTWRDYWADLLAADTYIADDWTDAYYGHFSGSSGSEGTRPLVVSYASSPPAEVYFAETELEEAPTGSIVADDTCFRQIEFAGVLANTDQPEEARRFIDFLLSREFQEDVPLTMFVFPVREDAELPEVFEQYAAVPEKPVEMPFDVIAENRERWLQEWTELVFQS